MNKNGKCDSQHDLIQRFVALDIGKGGSAVRGNERNFHLLNFSEAIKMTEPLLGALTYIHLLHNGETRQKIRME